MRAGDGVPGNPLTSPRRLFEAGCAKVLRRNERLGEEPYVKDPTKKVKDVIGKATIVAFIYCPSRDPVIVVCVSQGKIDQSRKPENPTGMGFPIASLQRWVLTTPAQAVVCCVLNPRQGRTMITTPADISRREVLTALVGRWPWPSPSPRSDNRRPTR